MSEKYPLKPGQYASDEIAELLAYVEGMADATENRKLSRVAYWLERFEDEVCGQGYIGCEGGKKCTSDHK